MSRLKIADLSFCETEFNNCSQVKGGMSFIRRTYRSRTSFLLPIEEADLEVVDKSVTENELMIDFSSENIDNSEVLVLKKDGNSAAISSIFEGPLPGGKFTSALAVAIS